MEVNAHHTLPASVLPLVQPQHDCLDDILISEPPISRILAEARRSYRPGQSADWREYNRLRRELEQYVGWSARRQQLRNAACWTIAHNALVNAVEGVQR